MNQQLPPDNLPDTTAEETTEKPARRRRRWWVRLLIWLLAISGSLALLVALVLTLIVWILTPEKLTPLVNRYASEYLIADVEAKRVELTFWSTFPRFSVEVDSLTIVSRSLRQLPDSVRRSLPADADSLLSMGGLRGGLNLLSLVEGNIELYDVDINRTRANLLQVDSLNANYLIVPPSEPKKDEEPSKMPDIAINRFTITDSLDVRMRIPTDSLDCRLILNNMALTDSSSVSQPLYTLALTGAASATLQKLIVPQTPFFANGKIAWESSKPMEVGLGDFSIGVGEVVAEFSTQLSMTDSLTVKELQARMPRVEIVKILNLLPDEQRALVKGLETDLSLEWEARLLKAYTPSTGRLPEVEASLKAKARKLVYDRLDLSDLEIDLDGLANLNNPDASIINLNRLAARGRAIDFELEAKVTKPLSDALIKGRFDGGVTFQNLPQILLQKLPMTLRGTLRGLADFNTRLSYLSPKLFHKARIDGNLTLDDFRMVMTDGSMESYIRHGDLKFGSSSTEHFKEVTVDSLLTVSMKIDTMALLSDGMALSGAALEAGVGARNLASSSDTSQINPIGASIKAGHLTLYSDSDSLRMRLREAQVSAALQRYEGNSRSPLLRGIIKAMAIRYADRYNRAGLYQSQITFNLHPKARPQMSARRKAMFDSLAARYPDLSSDSIVGMMRQRAANYMKRLDEEREGREDIKVELDNSMHSLLRRWNASGTLKTTGARVFTPYFPTRTTVRNLDMSFSTDSVVLRDTELRLGKSDFRLNGSISNLTRALLSRHGAPFKVNFSVRSDTIDVNDLTATMLRGAVLTSRIESGHSSGLADTDSDEILQSQLESQAADTTRAAVLIPSNIDGDLSLKAKHVLYSDLWLHGLDGLVQVYDGALNLDRLRASTAIGSVNFTALYSAPTVNDLSLAAAVRIRRLNLRSVLDMMPEVDSLLPLLGEVRGIVDADLALTTRLDSLMNVEIPSLNLALKISGDSLQLLDNETFRTIAKWMLFKHKDQNLINHMDVELAIHDGYIDLYPFIFDMDRYRLGVRGSNDAALNLNYHVAVIKSPIPFKFGINIKGTPEKMKIRLGKARINEKTVAESRQITDNVRINLVNEITRVFRRGVRATGSRGLKLQDSRLPGSGAVDGAKLPSDDKFTYADSVVLIQQGLLEAPKGFRLPGDSIAMPAAAKTKTSKSKK